MRLKDTITKQTALKTTFTEKAKTMEKKRANKDSQTTTFPIEIFLIPRYSEIIYSSMRHISLTRIYDIQYNSDNPNKPPDYVECLSRTRSVLLFIP